MAENYAKADLTKRFLAALIDSIIAGVVYWIPIIGPIIAIAYILLRDGLDFPFADGRSIGKKLLKLRPVRLDNQPMDIIVSFQRNLPLVIGALGGIVAVIPLLGWLGNFIAGLGGLICLIEGLLVLFDENGLRIGDRIANTRIIQVSD